MGPMMSTDVDIEAAARTVENALVGALHRDLRRQDRLAVAYSGGLDSTILARLVANYHDEDTTLVVVGIPGSRDVERARRTARFLDLPLVEVALSAARLKRDVATIVRLVDRSPVAPRVAQREGLSQDAQRVSPVMVGVQAALYYAFEAAKPFAERILLGQGADELFAGYNRYLGLDPEALRAMMAADLEHLQHVARPVEARVASHWGIEARYPYLEPGVIRVAQALPVKALIDQGVRKRVLRAVAARLGLPDDVIHVPKTAAQYGSGAARVLEELARASGQPQHEWLEALLEPAA
jgi:asparagine synthase (glutamine-hydrolysing)